MAARRAVCFWECPLRELRLYHKYFCRLKIKRVGDLLPKTLLCKLMVCLVLHFTRGFNKIWNSCLFWIGKLTGPFFQEAKSLILQCKGLRGTVANEWGGEGGTPKKIGQQCAARFPKPLPIWFVIFPTLFTMILHLCKNRSIRGTFWRKLSREYFSLWVFPVCTNKTSVTNRYITNKTWLNR